VVIAVAGWLFWRSPYNPLAHPSSEAPAVTSESSQTAVQQSPNVGDSAAPSETPLIPIKLSPQRMQSIGVKVGPVESKTISDEMRLYGNVQPNERRFAYVQTRFAGWIRQVYAD